MVPSTDVTGSASVRQQANEAVVTLEKAVLLQKKRDSSGARRAAELALYIIKDLPESEVEPLQPTRAIALNIMATCMIGTDIQTILSRLEIIQQEVGVLRNLSEKQSKFLFPLALALGRLAWQYDASRDRHSAYKTFRESATILQTLAESNLASFGPAWLATLENVLYAARFLRWHDRADLLKQLVADCSGIFKRDSITHTTIGSAIRLLMAVLAEVEGTTFPIALQTLRRDIRRLRRRRLVLRLRSFLMTSQTLL